MDLVKGQEYEVKDLEVAEWYGAGVRTTFLHGFVVLVDWNSSQVLLRRHSGLFSCRNGAFKAATKQIEIKVGMKLSAKVTHGIQVASICGKSGSEGSLEWITVSNGNWPCKVVAVGEAFTIIHPTVAVGLNKSLWQFVVCTDALKKALRERGNG